MGSRTPEMALAQVWECVCDIAKATGAEPLNALPGCWYLAVDERWELAINPHRETKMQQFRQSATPDEVPPFHMRVHFNGWLAGLLTPMDGSIAAGGLANIFTFADALAAYAEPQKAGAL